MHNFSV